MRSKKRRFAFQTFTETSAEIASILRLEITHQPHGGGGWCEMWREIHPACCITVDEVSERDIDEFITPERIARLLQ